MKRICSIVTAIVMGLTIFAIPTLGGATFAQEEQDAIVNAADLEDEATMDEEVVKAQALVQVTGLEVTGQTTSTISIKWNSVDGATGYKYSLNGAEGIEIGNVLEYTVEGLTPNTPYTLQVCAFDAEGDGEYSEAVPAKTEEEAVVPTAPGNVSSGSGTPTYDSISFTWGQVTGADGYAFSRGVDVLGNNKYRNNNKTLSFTWKGLKQRTTYTFYVRAYVVVPEGTEGGVWINPEGTSVANDKYVLLSPVAKKIVVTTKSKERIERTKYDKGYKYKYYDASGTFRGTSWAMWNTIKNKKSKTKYLIALDTRRNNIIIYKGKKGNWKPYKHFVCACGVEGHRTPRGDFKIQRKKPKFQTGDKVGAVVVRPKYTCWYATKFKGAVFFHSTLYYLNSKSRHAARHVGKHYSHGCVRLEIANAKWIYKNCGKGTAVISRKYGKDCSYGYQFHDYKY